MAKTSTLAEMRDRATFLGDFANSRKFTPAIVDREINAAVEDTWNVLVSARPDYYTLEYVVPTVAGVDSVALPTDFFRLRKAELSNGTRWRRLSRVELDATHQFGSTPATPTHYRLQANALKLYRTPDSVRQVRIYYLPCKSTMVADADTFDGINGFEDHAIIGAVVRLKMREGMPSAEWVAERNQLEVTIRTMASNEDVGQPYYMSGRQRGDDWDDVEELG
jgi:hypothetical protein